MIIPGGDLTEKDIANLVNTPDFGQFLHELQRFSWYETISEEVRKIEERGTIHHVIRALEKDALTKATKSSYLYPLSILPILDYLIRKRIEVDNLRIIARGKDAGLQENSIREMLVI
jgi:V/A-type H+-transporting ATPase subunit C